MNRLFSWLFGNDKEQETEKQAFVWESYTEKEKRFDAMHESYRKALAEEGWLI